MLGRHLIFAGTSTQAVISLSSGEREFYAAERGACSTLGLASLMLHLGFSMQADLRTDSKAAKGQESRRGAWTGATSDRTAGALESLQQAGSRLPAEQSERKLQFQRRRCWNCTRDLDVTEVRDELTLRLKTCNRATA